MLPSTGNFTEINCPFFDSGLCERPYCHFRHVRKDPSELIQTSAVNPASSSISSISLGDNGEILQQLVSEAVRKVLEQTELPLSRPSTSSAVQDVSRNLITKVTGALPPPLATTAPSSNTFNASSPQQKIPSYKPTPISLLKNKQNRHIPIPYSPSLCKSSSVLRRRTSVDDSSLAQKKIKAECVEANRFCSFYGSGVSTSGSGVKAYEPDNSVVEEPSVPDKGGDASQYLPAPVKGWKDNGLKYTPSSIETLQQQNAYVPSSRNPTEISVAPYEPSDKSQSSIEPTYEPLAPNGTSVGGAPYEPSRVSNVEPEYQPLCCDNTAKEYVPTDISKLENIENDDDLDITQKIELLHNYLHEEFDSINADKQKIGGGSDDVVVSSSDDVLKVVRDTGVVSSSEKTKSDGEKCKRKSDDKRRHEDKRRSDEKRKSDDKKRSESARKSDSKKRTDGDKKLSESSKSSDRKKSEGDKRTGDTGKRKSDKHKGEHEGERKEESEKRKSDVEKKVTDKKFSEHSHKRSESDKKHDSERKRSENDKKKSMSSRHVDSSDKSSSSHTNHKYKSTDDQRHSSKSNVSKSASKSGSEKKSEGNKKHGHSNKKSNNSHHGKHNADRHVQSNEKSKEDISKRKKSVHSVNLEDLKCHNRKKSKHSELKIESVDASNEFNLGNSLIESEVSDEEIFDAVTLPNDTWASSDEDSVTKECYRIFQEYEPSSAPKKPTPVAEPLEEINYEPVVKKQRIAHEGAENAKSLAPITKHNVGPQPAQVLSERFQKLRENLAQSQTNNPPVDLRSPPLPSQSIRSPPLPVARLDAKSSLNQTTVSMPPSGVKKRIAHVPNVSVLLDAKLKMQQKLKEQQLSCEKASRLGSASTKAQTVAKGSQRVAHMPSEQVLKRPIITEIGGKIPTNVRQTYLNILVDEYLKINPVEQEAYEKAEEEEKSIYSRSTTRAVYASHVSNTINRLRKSVQAGNASTSKGDDRVINRTVSHTSMLAGKIGTKGSWSIEKPRKPPASVTSKTLYEQLLQFVMTEEQLKENGYPHPHEDEKGVAVIHNFYKKPFVPKTPLQRMCARCSKIYYVNQQGKAVKEENCVYHWGRLFQSKTRGGWEARYNCCQGHGEAIGCSVAVCHVSDNFDPTNLRGFVKTLPKEKPPPDGDYGIYALDCEMCYTTVGLELTRVTVIGTDLKIVYESLVKPESTILDYNTRFSGIKEEDLEGVTTSIYEVQSVLLSFISEKTILIGHSLESDFKALKLIHSTVVDTSIVYPHKMGPPKKRALKTLCRDLLQKIIQENEGGHDSAEDARAAMEIMLHKVKEDLKTSW